MRHGTSTLARTLLAAGLAAASTPFGAVTSYAGPSQAEPIEVLGNAQNKFDPVDVTATPDDKGEITVTLKSEGAPHTWENKELGIDSGNVNAGEEKTFTFKAPPEGKHKVICLYHEALGMVGTLTVAPAGEGENDPDPSPTAGEASAPPASASASASVGAPVGGDNAPPQGSGDEGGEVEEGGDAHAVPGVEGNKTLERIEEKRAAQEGAVSGFKFFTFVAIAFLAILSAAVLFSTKPRRAGR